MSSTSVLTFLPAGDCLTTNSFKSKICYDRRWVRQSVLVSRTHLGPSTRFYYCQTVAGLLTRDPPPTRGWVCRLQLQLVLAKAVILGFQSRRIHDHILQSQIRDSHKQEHQVHVFFIPQEQGGPVIPPGTGFHFRRLLLLAGLRWRYLNPPPGGLTDCSNCLAYNISAQTAQKMPFFCCCFQLLPCRHACLRSRYSVTAVVFLFISRSFPSKVSTCLNIFISLFLTFQAYVSPLISYRPILNKNKLIL
jgi:hypothetical protein